MVFLGSIVIVLLLAFGVWMLLSPLYEKVGNKVKNKIIQFNEEDKGRKLK